MDKKRAAIVASAGVGLLVSAFVLHKFSQEKRSKSEESELPTRAVVLSEVSSKPSKNGNHIADAI